MIRRSTVLTMLDIENFRRDLNSGNIATKCAVLRRLREGIAHDKSGGENAVYLVGKLLEFFRSPVKSLRSMSARIICDLCNPVHKTVLEGVLQRGGVEGLLTAIDMDVEVFVKEQVLNSLATMAIRGGIPRERILEAEGFKKIARFAFGPTCSPDLKKICCILVSNLCCSIPIIKFKYVGEAFSLLVHFIHVDDDSSILSSAITGLIALLESEKYIQKLIDLEENYHTNVVKRLMALISQESVDPAQILMALDKMLTGDDEQREWIMQNEDIIPYILEKLNDAKGDARVLEGAVTLILNLSDRGSRFIGRLIDEGIVEALITLTGKEGNKNTLAQASKCIAQIVNNSPNELIDQLVQLGCAKCLSHHLVQSKANEYLSALTKIVLSKTDYVPDNETNEYVKNLKTSCVKWIGD